VRKTAIPLLRGGRPVAASSCCSWLTPFPPARRRGSAGPPRRRRAQLHLPGPKTRKGGGHGDGRDQHPARDRTDLSRPPPTRAIFGSPTGRTRTAKCQTGQPVSAVIEWGRQVPDRATRFGRNRVGPPSSRFQPPAPSRAAAYGNFCAGAEQWRAGPQHPGNRPYRQVPDRATRFGRNRVGPPPAPKCQTEQPVSVVIGGVTLFPQHARRAAAYGNFCAGAEQGRAGPQQPGNHPYRQVPAKCPPSARQSNPFRS
jgi:hypothetical protein